MSIDQEKDLIIEQVRDFVKVSECKCESDVVCWKHIFEIALNHLDVKITNEPT